MLKKDECTHEEYCDFSKSLCKETDFAEQCLMKDTPINDLPLLKKVKESVERCKEHQKNEEKQK